MSSLGGKILASLKEAVAAMDSGKPLDQTFAMSQWFRVAIPCGQCGGDNVLRRDRSQPSGERETALVCQDCKTAFWLDWEVK